MTVLEHGVLSLVGQAACLEALDLSQCAGTAQVSTRRHFMSTWSREGCRATERTLSTHNADVMLPPLTTISSPRGRLGGQLGLEGSTRGREEGEG